MTDTVPSRSDAPGADPRRSPTDRSPSGRAYRLADRYQQDDGRVFMSGSQALARLPLEQLRADRRAGLKTAAFISGYQGSPLAAYDRDIAAVKRFAEAEGYISVG